MSRLIDTPFQLKHMTLKNRLILPPMAAVKGDEQSRVNEGTLKYYDDMASKGFGLIFTEHMFVSPEGQASEKQLSISRDSDLEGLRKIVETVHRHGVPVIAQISHSGGAGRRSVIHTEPLSPSGIRPFGLGDQDQDPAVITEADMDRIRDDFAKAALRVKAAGFDGVEVHAAHGYYLCQFLSPLLNKRTDAYGGSLENRVRYPLSVVKAVREAVGSGFFMSLRFGACDYMEGGNTEEDAKAAAPYFEKAGIELFDISGGACYYRNPNSKEPGYFASSVRAVKAVSNIPVVLTGGIHTAEDAERFLADGTADLIGVGRAALKGKGIFEGE